MDATIAPAEGSDTLSANVELPVDIASLSIDGTAPGVGDRVEVKVAGAVTRVVNDMAYVKPETINDVPMPATPLEPNPMVDERDRLRRLSETADASGTPFGY